MIHTENLREIIKLALYSAHLKGDRSVSIMILAKPESGKTATMFEYGQNDGICMMSDLTYTGLVSLLDDVKHGKTRTVLIPDMLKVFGRKVDTAKNFITLLNEFIEEGILNIQTFANQITFDSPVRANVVAAITDTDFTAHVQYWGTVGFLSRIIPFSYQYSVEDVNRIFKSIMKGEFSQELQRLTFSKVEKHVSMTMGQAERLRTEVTCNLIAKFSKAAGAEIYGFRLQRNLQVLAKASALADGRGKVSTKDVNKICSLANWMNYDMNVIK